MQHEGIVIDAEFGDGPLVYGLPVNQSPVTLAREEWTVPQRLALGGEELVPLRAGEKLPWKLA